MKQNIRKEQSFQYGAAILICSTVIVKLIGALFKIPLSSDKCLGDLGFGYFVSAYDLYTPIYSLAMAGLPIAVSRIVAEYTAKKRYRDVRSSFKISRRLFFITGTVGFILMLALIFPFVKLTDPTGKSAYSLFAIAPCLLFCCVMSSYRGYYEGLRNMYPTAVSDVIEALGKLILGFGFAYATVKITGNVAYGAAAAMLGISVGAMFSAIYLHLYYRFRGDRITEADIISSPRPVDDRIAAKAIIVIAIPVVLASLANNVATLVDVALVKWQLSNLLAEQSDVIRQMYEASFSAYEISSGSSLINAEIPTYLYGIRGKAFTIYNLVPTLTSVLGVSALPVLATSWVQNKREQVKHNLESMLKLMALISFPAGIGLVAVGPRIMGLLYSSYASTQIGGTMLRIFGFAALFAGIAIPVTNMLQAVGKQVSALRNIAIGVIIKVIVNFVLVGIPQINIMGAPYGTLACYAFIFFSNLITLITSTGILPDINKVFIKPLVASLCCGATAFIISQVGNTRIITLFSVFVAAIVYFVVLIIENTFEESDISSLPKGEKLLKLSKKLRIIR